MVASFVYTPVTAAPSLKNSVPLGQIKVPSVAVSLPPIHTVALFARLATVSCSHCDSIEASFPFLDWQSEFALSQSLPIAGVTSL